jgi:hypothetical protein
MQGPEETVASGDAKPNHDESSSLRDAFKQSLFTEDLRQLSFRADLKSKVSQATKKAGEFQMRKRGAGSMVTATIAGVKTAKKPTPKSKQAEDETVVGEEGHKGWLLMMMVMMPLLWHANARK